jgi:hypothetical protein
MVLQCVMPAAAAIGAEMPMHAPCVSRSTIVLDALQLDVLDVLH